jgi:hypothetical protein
VLDVIFPLLGTARNPLRFPVVGQFESLGGSSVAVFSSCFLALAARHYRSPAAIPNNAVSPMATKKAANRQLPWRFTGFGQLCHLD